MAREGLFDDTGWHGCDFIAPCEQGACCKHERLYEENGQTYSECTKGCCEFEEE